MAEKDWKVVRTDEHPVLDEKDMEIQRLKAENQALRSAFAQLRDRLTEVSLQAEDDVIAINTQGIL